MDGQRESDRDGNTVWPLLHAVVALALVLRLIVAWGPPQVSYPDEVFQYLEQAHRLVYGYGFVTWEYRFGIRNWLLPGTLAGLLAILKGIGITEPGLYIPVLKSLFAVVSLSVVYASYTIGRTLFGERTGRFAALFAAVWYELVSNSVLPTPEVLGGYALLGALALMMAAPTWRRVALTGLLAGLAVALRVQYAIPAAALTAFVLIGWGWRNTLVFAAAGAAIPVVAGLLDWWTWGTPFISYWNSILFNVGYGVSNIFGQRPTVWYLFALTLGSAGLFAAAGIYGLIAWKRCWPILLVMACVLLPHTLLAHKEYRFIFLAVPLLLLLLADGIAYGLTRVVKQRFVLPVAAAAVVMVSALGAGARGVLQQDDRLAASLYLSQQADLKSLIDVSGHWTSSGGFFYLHRDVPYYFAEQVGSLPSGDLKDVASHVIISGVQELPAGFRISRRFGDILVLEQEAPPAAYRALPEDGRNAKLPWIDDRLTPTVRPRL